ncbi:MAG TPA: poly-gamma-glutamate system protein, partial [Acidobacteriota bacterium]|nr:poly-gamma-glutamate system protein [Acidobacteriota bacterium]
MKKVFLYAAAVLSVAYAAFLALRPARGPILRDEMLQASTLMAAAEAAVRDCRVKAGVAIDPEADPNGTGLVGLETSPITTSLGNLGAKRTTTNPNFAGLVAALLAEAGVRSGDTIAVGASGSFPALIIATLSAARVMNLRVLLVTSLGASEWGANDPAFGWLDMDDCL